jgi:long-chain acyl-CoA synthetase
MPDKPALIEASTGEMLTYRNLAVNIDATAKRLQGVGVKEGDIIVALLPRNTQLVELILGASRLGAVVLPYSYPRDCAEALGTARRSFDPCLFVATDGSKNFNEALPGELWISSSDLKHLPMSGTLRYQPVPASPLYLNESSGSSGIPKIVVATHAAILANTVACIKHFQITIADVHLCLFQSHAHDWFVRALISGGSAVLVEQTVHEAPEQIIKVIGTQGVTCLMLNPLALETLLDLVPRNTKLSLRFVETGGFPTPPRLKPQVKAKLQAELLPVWGSTETGGVAIATSLNSNEPEGSVGKPLPGYCISILGRDRDVVAAGEEGDLVITAESVASAYIVNGRDGLGAGTFWTGDIATTDSEGHIFIRGRASNRFKVCGFEVSAEFIEQQILQVAPETVAEVAVVAVPHSLFGYLPGAMIVLKPGTASDIGIRRWATNLVLKQVRFRLPSAAIQLPRSMKVRMEPLPRIPGGKVDRQAVRKQYFQHPKPFKIRIPHMIALQLLGSFLGWTRFMRLLRQMPIRLIGRVIHKL